MCRRKAARDGKLARFSERRVRMLKNPSVKGGGKAYRRGGRKVDHPGQGWICRDGRSRAENPDALLPRIHRVVSLLKRWLLGTHQGAVERKHLPYYLDEFTFRFNRRKSRRRGMLFYRIVQQALAVDPAPYRSLVGGSERDAAQDVGVT